MEEHWWPTCIAKCSLGGQTGQASKEHCAAVLQALVITCNQMRDSGPQQTPSPHAVAWQCRTKESLMELLHFASRAAPAALAQKGHCCLSCCPAGRLLACLASEPMTQR